MLVNLFFSICLFHCVVTGQECSDVTSFATKCTTIYSGIINGGRCFFMPRNPGTSQLLTATWADAFATCKNQSGNAAFAQIYTNSEYTAIKNFYLSTAGTYLWIALYTNPASSGPAIHLQNTRYYTSNTTYDPKVAAGQTFLTQHVGEDPTGGGNPCIMLLGSGSARKFSAHICSHPHNVLCSFYNYIQNFTHVPNKCMAEPIIESIPVNTAVQCADGCASRMWCRSINWHPQAMTCDFFAWHSEDSTNILTNQSDCELFTYVP